MKKLILYMKAILRLQLDNRNKFCLFFLSYRNWKRLMASRGRYIRQIDATGNQIGLSAYTMKIMNMLSPQTIIDSGIAVGEFLDLFEGWNDYFQRFMQNRNLMTKDRELERGFNSMTQNELDYFVNLGIAEGMRIFSTVESEDEFNESFNQPMKTNMPTRAQSGVWPLSFFTFTCMDGTNQEKLKALQQSK